MPKRFLVFIATVALIALAGFFVLINKSALPVLQPQTGTESTAKETLLDTSDWITSRNKTHKFSFKYPSDFGERGGRPNDARTLRKPNQEFSGATEALNGKYVQIDISPNFVSAEGFKKLGVDSTSVVDFMKKVYKENVNAKTAETLGEKDLNIDGKRGYMYSFKNTMNDTYWIATTIGIELSPNSSLMINFQFRNLPFDKKLVDTILSTLKVEK